MKKRKLSCLLALMLCVTAPLAACKDDETANAINEHFYWDDARTAYSQVVEIEGVVESYDEQHNLAVIRSTKDSNYGSVMDEVKVINLLTDEVIFSATASNPADTPEAGKETIDVNVSYPVIELARRTVSKNTNNPEPYSYSYSYSYYYAKSTGMYRGEESPYYGDISIATNLTEKASANYVTSYYGIYRIQIEDKEYWVNEDMQVLRTFNKAQTSGLSNPTIKGAYGDYLYAWDLGSAANAIQVYNTEGICSMQYTLPSDVVGVPSGVPCILNNGNIFVQEFVAVDEDATDYDCKVTLQEDGEAEKVNLRSKIVDYKTGAVKEVELDYVVYELEAAYVNKDSKTFPWRVREADQNVAYIIKLEKQQEISTCRQYVTLDNDMNVTFTVKNDLIAGQSLYGWDSVAKMNDKYYFGINVTDIINGSMEYWMFDTNGNKVALLPSTFDECTDEYIITEYGVYDYDKKCLYDFETSPFFNTNLYEGVNVLLHNETICISAFNCIDMTFECYEFNGKDFVKAASDTYEFVAEESRSLPEGNTATIERVLGDEVKVTYNAGSNSYDWSTLQTSYMWTLYAENGKPLLKKQINSASEKVLTQCEDAAFTSVTLSDGRTITYVVR